MPPQPIQPQINTPSPIPLPVSYSPITNIAPMIPPAQPNPIAAPYNSYNPYAYPSYPQQSYYNSYPPQNFYQSGHPVNNIYSPPAYNSYYQPQAPQYNYQPTYFEKNTSPVSTYAYNSPQKSTLNVSNSQPNGKQN